MRAIELFGSVPRQGPLCRNTGPKRATSRQRAFMCRDGVVPRVGHSCHDRRFYVATGFLRVVSRPIDQASAHDRPGRLVSTRTCDGAARMIERSACDKGHD